MYLTYEFNYSERDESLYSKPELVIEQSEDDKMDMTVERARKKCGH